MTTEDMIIMSNKEQDRAETLALIAARRLKQSEGAELLDLSVRQVKRLCRLYKLHGIKGLVSKKRGGPSNNKLHKLLESAVIAKIQKCYNDFGPTFAHEKLTEDDKFKISLSSVRRLMIQHKIWIPKMDKAPSIHPRRERRPCFGELMQIDGSKHHWFEDRAPSCCLIVFIDDATSRLTALKFVPVEAIFPYFAALEMHMLNFGRPLALYSDKHGIFRVNVGSDKESRVTQFGRAVKQLGIHSINAHSPQAKGRVERVNGTLQDRLVKELRLREISSIDEANDYLPEFIEDHNRRFAVAPKDPTDAHKTLDPRHDLKRILSIHYERKVSKSLSFQFKNTHYQILAEGRQARNLLGKKILVAEYLHGGVGIYHDGRPLAHTRMDAIVEAPPVADCKTINVEFDLWKNKKKPHTPRADHPWKQSGKPNKSGAS